MFQDGPPIQVQNAGDVPDVIISDLMLPDGNGLELREHPTAAEPRDATACTVVGGVAVCSPIAPFDATRRDVPGTTAPAASAARLSTPRSQERSALAA